MALLFDMKMVHGISADARVRNIFVASDIPGHKLRICPTGDMVGNNDGRRRPKDYHTLNHRKF